MLKSGIYKIENIINGKFYIGSAERLVKRKNNHLCYPRNGTHTNIKLQRAFNKYGEDYFKFSIIETCENNLLIEREQYYIDSLNPFYNICRIAGRTEGRIASEETKEKMRLSHSQRNCKHSKETKKIMREKALLSGRKPSKEAVEKSLINRFKPILQYDINHNFIKEFCSIAEAARELKIHGVGIVNSAKGRRKTSGGFIWKYKKGIV